jgi:transposase
MRSKGSPVELEHRRLLAVPRLVEGYSSQEVADFLGVDPSTVRRWRLAFHKEGVSGLCAQPIPGRPRKLTRTQEKIVCRWLADRPVQHGFDTDLWTAARLAELIRQEWDIAFNPRYLSCWLQAQGFSPQKPERVPRERDPEAIATWLQSQWVRIKKKRAGSRRTWFLSTKVGS